MITGAFGTLGFISPWILAGLIFLPALWYLLRVTPPAPRHITFPAARFLVGLYPDDHTASRTPWWVLLLRLAVLAFVITALARPILNPAETLPGRGAVRIVMENGWAAAQTWPQQLEEATSLIDRAGRERREIYILTTAPEPGKAAPAQQGPLTEGQAKSVLKGLRPLPWPAAYDATAKLAQDSAARESISSYWLSSGLRDGDPDTLIRALQTQGGLSVFTPEPARSPLLLRFSRQAGNALKVLVDYIPGTARNTPVTLQVLGMDGRLLDVQKHIIPATPPPLALTVDLPESLRGQIGQIRLAGRDSAGSVLLLDDDSRRRPIGVVVPPESESGAPLVEAGFYLNRALEPFGTLHTGAIADLVAQKMPVIILPDIGGLPAEDLNALEEWVRQGGLLLRFAGPHMTQTDNFLMPVPIRKGGRALDGGMTWDKPQTLRPFPAHSPYADLPVPQDLTVSRQLLAEPVPGIETMTWAALQDGTPLITANALDRGLLVLVHTTATPEWSDLALSGTFVQILKRTIRLAGSSSAQIKSAATLQPLMTLNGYGHTESPGAYVTPIDSARFDATTPSSLQPPGLYGYDQDTKALNLGDRLPELKSFGDFPSGVAQLTYGENREKELMPLLLQIAFGLFLLDWLIMIVLQTSLRLLPGWRQVLPVMAALFLACAAPPSAQAETPEDMIRYAGSIHLAYIRTGVETLDSTTQTGLETLSQILTTRTSVEPSAVIAVDPESDVLSFFPLIYWPVTAQAQPLSARALHNIQAYLDHGGTIIFDTAPAGGSNDALRAVTAGLNIPPLVPIPAQHVLLKSFYLLKELEGLQPGGTVWVEDNSASGRDGVSSVIIGSHDWAGAWARADRRPPSFDSAMPPQEVSLRTGVNFVMYALTGNYKADQVHLPHILERLGQ